MRTFPARAILIAAALFAAAVPTMAAQGVQAPAPARVDTVMADTAARPLHGPRVGAELRRVEPNIAVSPEPFRVQGRNHTFTISTLALVLAVVVLVLLIT